MFDSELTPFYGAHSILFLCNAREGRSGDRNNCKADDHEQNDRSH
jgi:hypothetical protein